MDENLEQVQDELKVLKNELKETLTDIRDYLLAGAQNPFSVEPKRADLPSGRREALPGPDEEAEGIVTPTKRARREVEGGEMPAPAPFTGPSMMAPPAPWPGQLPYGAPYGGAPSVLGGAPTAPSESAPEAKETPKNGHSGTLPWEGSPSLGQKATPKDGHDGISPWEDGPSLGQRDEAPAQPGAVADRPGDKAERHAPGGPEVGTSPSSGPQQEVDLVTVAMLAPWLEASLRRIGRERLRVLVNMYASMGSLSPRLKDTILQLMQLDGSSASKVEVPLKECLQVLADLDNLMMRSRLDMTGAAILSVYLSRKGAAGANSKSKARSTWDS